MNPFAALMRRYCIAYVNCHDFSLLPEIMVDDYRLAMGEHVLTGRDGQYAHAARIQMNDVPGMLLTVHEIVTNGDRLAMRFSEHGASKRHGGKQAVWAGVALYRWDGTRLTHCSVEQDYYARPRQYAAGAPDRVDAPAAAPWDTQAQPANEHAEQIVRRWIEAGMTRLPRLSFDDEWLGAPAQDVLTGARAEVLDLFSAGASVAFHVRQEGSLAGPSSGSGAAAGPCFLHSAGIVHVESGAISSGRVVRDRMGLERRLRNKVVKVG